jgi:hypothetical protein
VVFGQAKCRDVLSEPRVPPRGSSRPSRQSLDQRPQLAILGSEVLIGPTLVGGHHTMLVIPRRRSTTHAAGDLTSYS